jgi:hypothetical protein
MTLFNVHYTVLSGDREITTGMRRVRAADRDLAAGKAVAEIEQQDRAFNSGLTAGDPRHITFTYRVDRIRRTRQVRI